MFLFFLSRKQFRISTIFLAYRHESIKENSPFHYFQYLSTVVLMKWSYFFTFRIPAKVPNAKINRVVPDFEKKIMGALELLQRLNFSFPTVFFFSCSQKSLELSPPFPPRIYIVFTYYWTCFRPDIAAILPFVTIINKCIYFHHEVDCDCKSVSSINYVTVL